MYSGLLPKGFTESDLSSDAEEDGQCEEEQGNTPNSSTENVRGIAGETSLTADGVDPSQTPADPQQDREPPTDILPGISQEMWQVCCLPCSVINYYLLAAHKQSILHILLYSGFVRCYY